VQVDQILAEIDSEIELLQQVRRLLAGLDGRRSKGSKAAKLAKKTAGKSKISAEGRRRISEALKRRWAARKKEASAGKLK